MVQRVEVVKVSIGVCVKGSEVGRAALGWGRRLRRQISAQPPFQDSPRAVVSLLWKAEAALYYESCVRSVEDPSGSPEEGEG